MLSPRSLSMVFLLAGMEVLSGFTVIVGTGLLDVTSLHYSLFWLLLLVAVSGSIVGLAVAGLTFGDRESRVVVLGVGVLVAAALAWLTADGLVRGFVSALLLGVSYWRGTAVIQEPPDYPEVQRRFGFGFGVLFLGIIWIVARGIIYQRPVWHMLALVGIGYTIVGMVALVLARTERVREPGAGKAVALAVILQLGLVVLISFGALELFAHDVAGWLFSLTHPVWDAAGYVLAVVASVLLTPVMWLAELIHSHARTPRPLQPVIPPHQVYGHGKRLKHHYPVQSPWLPVVGLVFVALTAVGIAALIWRSLPHRPPRRADRGYTEERHRLSLREVWDSLLAWLRGLFRRGADLTGQAAAKTRRRFFGPTYPADPIRGMYARLLRRAELAGIPRTLAVTPAEFQAHLATRWPEGADDFAVLTEAYNLCRYGEVAFQQAQVDGLKRRWQHVHSLMRRQRSPLDILPRDTTNS